MNREDTSLHQGENWSVESQLWATLMEIAEFEMKAWISAITVIIDDLPYGDLVSEDASLSRTALPSRLESWKMLR